MCTKFQKLVLAQVTASNFFRRILRSEGFNSFFFLFFRIAAVLRKLFDFRFSYKHCNFSRGWLPVEIASKTVIRSTEALRLNLTRFN